MAQAFCKHCYHPAHRAECGVDDCGCVRYEPRVGRDPESLRLWIVTASFFVKNRWMEGEARVRAAGLVGATTKGLREIKRQVLPPRTRVGQTQLTVVPVKGSGGKR